MTIAVCVTGFLLVGKAAKGPGCVPFIFHLASTRPPSAMRSSTVKPTSGNPGPTATAANSAGPFSPREPTKSWPMSSSVNFKSKFPALMQSRYSRSTICLFWSQTSPIPFLLKSFDRKKNGNADLPKRGRILQRPIAKRERWSAGHFLHRVRHPRGLAAPNERCERQQGID
jgi:hypothetical protein